MTPEAEQLTMHVALLKALDMIERYDGLLRQLLRENQQLRVDMAAQQEGTSSIEVPLMPAQQQPGLIKPELKRTGKYRLRECAGCDAIYEPTSGRQLYCDSCRKQVRKL